MDKAFKKFLADRVVELTEKLTKDQEVKELNGKISEIMRRIKELASPELCKLYLELDDLDSQRCCLFEDALYVQGFRDAICIKELMKNKEALCYGILNSRNS